MSILDLLNFRNKNELKRRSDPAFPMEGFSRKVIYPTLELLPCIKQGGHASGCHWEARGEATLSCNDVVNGGKQTTSEDSNDDLGQQIGVADICLIEVRWDSW